MALASPALHPASFGTQIDIHHLAEYPILLGDALRDTTSLSRSRIVEVRYNWKPKGLSGKQEALITRNDDSSPPYRLTLREDTSDETPFQYSGNVIASKPAVAPQPEHLRAPTNLALTYDASKQAFILEPVSSSFNFNIASGPGQSSTNISTHQQLPLQPQDDGNHTTTTSDGEQILDRNSDDEDNDEPDKDNPFDFRHFLKEAKEAAEPTMERGTPRLGGMSPLPGASRFLTDSRPGTPLQRPATPMSTGFAPVAKKRKVDTSSRKVAVSSAQRFSQKKTSVAKRKGPKIPSSAKRQNPSSERVSDSGEEIGDTITLPPPPSSRPKKATRGKNKTGARDSKYVSSPRITVDEASDFVIEMGSPPGDKAGRGERLKVNADALTGRRSTILSPDPRHGAEVDTDLDAEGEPDPDFQMADADVEDLNLPSPRAPSHRATSISGSRIEPAHKADDDDDDALAAELEAALVDEDGGEEGGVGLGITSQAQEDDESEVSEEE